MKTLIFIIVSLFSTFVYAQEYNIQILDSVTRQPISYVLVATSIEKGNYFYTDSTGRFSYKQQVDSLITLYHMAYQNKTINTSNLYNGYILLVPKILQLREAVITANKYKNKKKVKLGYNGLSNRMGATYTSGVIVASYIPNNKGYDCLISDILITLSESNRSEAGLFRLHLYNVDERSREPQEELLFDTRVYSSTEHAKSKFTSDISAFNIVFPKEGIFVGIEWLTTGMTFKDGSIISTNPQLRHTSKIDKEYTWIKTPSADNWTELMKFYKFLQYPFDKPLNACIGIKVVENK